MYKCWLVYDLDQEKVVEFWYGEQAPAQWSRNYADSERYHISSEYQGGHTYEFYH